MIQTSTHDPSVHFLLDRPFKCNKIGLRKQNKDVLLLSFFFNLKRRRKEQKNQCDKEKKMYAYNEINTQKGNTTTRRKILAKYLKKICQIENAAVLVHSSVIVVCCKQFSICLLSNDIRENVFEHFVHRYFLISECVCI